MSPNRSLDEIMGYCFGRLIFLGGKTTLPEMVQSLERKFEMSYETAFDTLRHLMNHGGIRAEYEENIPFVSLGSMTESEFRKFTEDYKVKGYDDYCEDLIKKMAGKLPSFSTR